ncbi:MAG TPA: metallophosphoesterase [Ilumatobacteraceae bacterium]
MARIVQVSDSHLSPTVAYANENWAGVVEEVRRLQPELVVHSGDLSLDGATRPADLEHAWPLLHELPQPWRVIPGNHDIGDIASSDDPIDEERRARWTQLFGDGSWTVDLDGWRLVGLDVQTLCSSLPQAADLWEWLGDVTATDAPLVLFIHRPICPLDPSDDDDPNRYVPSPDRERLLTLVRERDVRLVASGHVHQWRQGTIDRLPHVWAPSTWASLPDWIQPRIGTKVTGMVSIELDHEVHVELLRPPAVADVVIGDDFESPYGGDH